MPRDNKQKIKLLYLMEILRQDTDEQHPISTNQICKRLAEQGISCERRTVGMDMKVLNEFNDNKGIFLVGNYGTGKSHLMSLVSAVAHDSKYLSMVQNKRFAEDAKRIAGKFEVLRIEIGASTMSLRDIILSKIKEDFKARGLLFSYPAQNEIVNNKGILTDMMALFAGKYGEDKGYLVVIDEMLDYLGGRKEQEVKLDFGFLRELGEICKNSRFRIICGI